MKFAANGNLHERTYSMARPVAARGVDVLFLLAPSAEEASP
jgi:hypothetical protein